MSIRTERQCLDNVYGETQQNYSLAPFSSIHYLSFARCYSVLTYSPPSGFPF